MSPDRENCAPVRDVPSDWKMFLNKGYRTNRGLLLCTLISLVILTSCRTQKPGEVVFEPYRFETIAGQKIEAQLGRLTVPENRNNPQSRLIELAFVLLKSTAKNPDVPIIFLAGGPGVSGIENAQSPRSPLLLAMLNIGDVVLLDQRGTGLSTQLSCDERLNYPFDQPANREGLVESFKRQARLCSEEKRGSLDLSAYNTEESASDVNALREALGADKISLLGSSYGTTLALTIIRRYGEHIHKAIMVGVEGPDQTLKLPANGQKQLLKLSALVRNDPNLGPSVPDLIATLTTVAERLKNQPATIEVDDPEGLIKKKVAITVGEFDLKLMTALTIGYDGGISGFPAALYSMAHGDYSSLGRWALHFRRQQANATQAAMDCASGVSPDRWRQIQDEENTAILGRDLDFPFPDACEGWGVPQLEPAFRSEIRSNIPALFISGSLDGRTPASNAEEIRKGFSNSTMTIIEGAAHGDRLFVGSPQITEVMLNFMKGDPRLVTQIVLPPVDFEPLKVRVTPH